jgi:hypothetical protein
MSGRDQSEWSRIKEAQRVARERREAQRKRRDAQMRVNATPQTVRKLERPVVDRLLARGQIGDEQHRAAEEIARVWIAITSYLFPRVSDPSQSGGRSADRDWPPSLVTAYRERYGVWRDEAAAVQLGHRRTLADLVFMVAVDNYGPRQIERLWGMNHARVLHLVRISLWRYAELAGWTDGPFRPPVAPLDISQLTTVPSRD